MAKQNTPPRAAFRGSRRPGLHDSALNFTLSPREVMSDNAQPEASREPQRLPMQPAHGWLAPLAGMLSPLAAILTGNSRPRRALVLTVALLATSIVKLPAQPAEAENQLRVFAPQTTYVVPLVEHNGAPYVGLFEVLEPLGRVESHVDRQRWKLKFSAPSSRTVEVEFTGGTARGKVAGSGYDLPSEFLLLGGRGFVPVTALGGMLPRVLSQTVQLQPGNRLLIGPIGFSFNQQVRQDSHALVLSFQSPVNPMIATEPGRIRLTFTREPVIRPADGGAQKFSDPVIQSTSVVASNGALQLTVNVSSPVIANFSDGNKTITLAPVAAPESAQAKPAAPSTAPPANPPQANPSLPVATVAAVPARPVVVIDAAHGGSDHGAILAGNIPEKDLTLSLARLIQHDLEAQGVATRMVRTGDADLDFDQRAAAANSAHILAYIAIHAASEGRGVRLYTALLPPTAQTATHKQFLPWNKAQASWLDLSGSLAGSVAAEFNQRKMKVRAQAFPLRPLNNIWAPAVALEVTPPAGEKDIKSGAYLRDIAAAVSAGVLAMRSKLEAAR